MELNDRRILEFLEKRLKGKNITKEKFLNPTEDDFRDARKLPNINAATEKIKDAVRQNKRILVYGDYDADGICSSTILYLFLKSIDANVHVYIPNRFENGYGISVEAIEEIIENFSPELVITVDLGITAIEEVEILKQESIDIVITDHHIPLAEIPDCIVVDPKLECDYGFDGLCGAGVALKVVEAMAGRAEALKFLDICAIATVGDIVPLVDENRTIAKLGIEKINNGNCLKSISFLLKKLDIVELTSTDISFKIVPRLNACGRMDSAIKVFDFLIQTDEAALEKKYSEMEYDNDVRLSFIEKGNKIIDRSLDSYNFEEPAIVIKGDFHEGIIGILASRVCHEYGRPAIIFTKTEDGTLKGSGRSIEKINLHEIISSMRGLLENFGGHKMAIGVEILEENFEIFKNTLNQKIKETSAVSDLIINSDEFDIEITEDDLNENFYRQLCLLEPFGFENEKPILAIKQSKMNVVPISEKGFKHYNLFTKKNIRLTAFNYYKMHFLAQSDSEKYIFVDISYSYYKSRRSLNFVARSEKIITPKFDSQNKNDILASLYDLYYSIFDFNKEENYHVTDELKSVIDQKFKENEFGTLVVCSTEADYACILELGLQDYISSTLHPNGQNTVFVCEQQIYTLSSAKGYKNIIFLHKNFEREHLYFSQKYNVFEPKQKTNHGFVFSKERDVFVRVYKLLINMQMTKANDILDFANKVSILDNSIEAHQVLFCLIVFLELNIFEFDENLSTIVAQKTKKMELASSKFYNEVE